MREDMRRIGFQLSQGRTWSAAKRKAKHRRANRSQDVEALDDLCPHEGMRRYARGELMRDRGTDYAVEKFLESRVGKLWNEVYAEICEHADSRTWLGRELRIQALRLVHLNRWSSDPIEGKTGFSGKEKSLCWSTGAEDPPLLSMSREPLCLLTEKPSIKPGKLTTRLSNELSSSVFMIGSLEKPHLSFEFS